MPISIVSKESSIIQASDAETAHREHESPQHSHQQSKPKKSTGHSHAQHHHLHHRMLRGRQAVSIPPSDIPEVVAPPEVTQVVQTISVIQQVNVDEGGSTVGFITYTDVSAEPSATAVDVDVSQSPMPSSQADEPASSYSAIDPDDLPTDTGSIVPTATAPALLITTELPEPELPTSGAPSDVPATESPATELPATELPASELLTELPPAKYVTQDLSASPSPSINATTISSSSTYTTFLSSTKSALSTNSRSTTTIPSSSSTTSAISIDSLLSSLSSSTGTSTSSFTSNAESDAASSSIETTSGSSALSYTPASDDASPSATETVGLVGGAGAIGAPNTPNSNDTSSSKDSNSESNDPLAIDTPPKVAGVVVGSIAAVAVLLVIAFYILKRIKQNKGGAVRLSTGSQQLGLAGTGAGAPMIEKESHGFFLPVYNAFRTRPKQVAGGSPEAGASEEPSFVRVSGRKLPSVLQHGGDGYGGPGEIPPIPQHLSRQLNDASFYQDDTGYHGGIGESNTGVSTAVAGGGLIAGAAATQRDRSPGRSPMSAAPRSTPSANQPMTPFRSLHDYQNPFSSPGDPISSPHGPYASSNKPVYREGPMRNTTVVPTPPQRSQSQHLMISSGLSASPEHGSIKEETASQVSASEPSPAQPHTRQTEISGSSNYTDAREFENLDQMVLRRPDPLGRSHPSQDGSKGSRFREDV